MNQDVDEICDIAGECKEDPQRNKNHLTANMMKVAAEVGQEALKEETLFKRIIVYGLLCEIDT